MDILIKNARIRKKENLVDIGIENGKIVQIGEIIKEKADRKIDVEGNLVAPTFIDPFIHLDKVFIAEVTRENISGTWGEAIEIIMEKKKNYTIEEAKERGAIEERAGKYIQLAVSNGVTIIRSHVDVDTIAQLVPLKALLKIKKEYSDIADIQIVAFPQEGILQDEGTEELLYKAMELGAEVVGGIPANEVTDEDSKKHIDIVFNIAKEFNADIDMHIDETDDPSSRTIQYFAAKAVKENYQGRVTAGHVCALAAYDDYYAAKVIHLIKKAQMNIKLGPQCELMVQGRLDKQPIRRGITRVKELIEAGINVTYGQDITKDVFVPTFGQADPLEVGLIMAHAAQFHRPHEIEILFDMPTINAAKTLRMNDYGIRVDNTANLNVIGAKTVQEAFRVRADRLFVIKRGKIVAENKSIKKIWRFK